MRRRDSGRTQLRAAARFVKSRRHMDDAFQDLSRSEQLLDAAETSSISGREAAMFSLRALLEEWNEVPRADSVRSEEHTSELQSHSFISYAVFCLNKKK